MNVAYPNSLDDGSPLEYYTQIMKQLDADQVKNFVRELSKISRKHKIKIGGCGCCGSPFLSPMEKDDGRYEVDSKAFDELKWKRDTDEPA